MSNLELILAALYIVIGISFAVGLHAKDRNSYDKTPLWMLVVFAMLWPITLPALVG